jgi:hypothetical protein
MRRRDQQALGGDGASSVPVRSQHSDEMMWTVGCSAAV